MRCDTSVCWWKLVAASFLQRITAPHQLERWVCFPSGSFPPSASCTWWNCLPVQAHSCDAPNTPSASCWNIRSAPVAMPVLFPKRYWATDFQRVWQNLYKTGVGVRQERFAMEFCLTQLFHFPAESQMQALCFVLCYFWRAYTCNMEWSHPLQVLEKNVASWMKK